MRKFQELVNQHKRVKPIQKLSFQSLSKTINMQPNQQKRKPNHLTFKQMACEAKEQPVEAVYPLTHRATRNISSFAELTLKKERYQSEEETVVCRRQKPKAPGDLDGITIIDSVAIQNGNPSSEGETGKTNDLNTIEKKQVEKEIGKITLDLKSRLFHESKQPNTLRQVMDQVHQVLDTQTQRVYTKILHQRRTSRGTSVNSTLNSNKSSPNNLSSCLSISNRRSPIVARYQSDGVSPPVSEVAASKYKSTSRFIKAKLTGLQSVRVTQFLLQ